VLETPKMSFWMILIPIILVYHVFRVRRVVEGRKGFVRNYLANREQALEESYALLDKDRKPDFHTILGKSNLPDEAKGPFEHFFSLLVEHYADLLRSNGHDMASLIRSAYKTRTNYLLFLNRMNKAEKALNNGLRSLMDQSLSDIDLVIGKMEFNSERLRREEAERMFS
jgi:hypothetical protein